MCLLTEVQKVNEGKEVATSGSDEVTNTLGGKIVEKPGMFYFMTKTLYNKCDG